MLAYLAVLATRVAVTAAALGVCAAGCVFVLCSMIWGNDLDSRGEAYAVRKAVLLPKQKLAAWVAVGCFLIAILIPGQGFFDQYVLG